MEGKHFSDVLFDYLIGTFHVSFSDEETARVMKEAAKNTDPKTEDVFPETKE